jgi:hypothetical protein
MPARARSVLALAALLAVPAAPALAAHRVVLSSTEIDLGARRAARQRDAAPLAGGLAAPALAPSDHQWLVPFVVDAGNLSGTTTLFSVRNEVETASDVEIGVEILDPKLMLLHSFLATLGPDEVASYNVRDMPGLPAGFSRGIVRVTPGDVGSLVSVDSFEVTPGEDFATGSLGIDFVTEECAFWRSRLVIGGPFTGGTELTFIVDGPRGVDPEGTPTITGNVYDEPGNLVNTFLIFTDDYVLAVNADGLVVPDTLFGSVELLIDATAGGGYVNVALGAEGRYSVGFSGVCKDSVPVP